MIRTPTFLERAARHLGGPRVLALPLLRVLAAALGVAWVTLAPRGATGRHAAALTVLAFVVYSTGIIGALWIRPAAVLRRNVFVLLVDLAFALTLIAVTGGARSTLFLALLVIAGLQSYYYGIARGLAVGVVSAIGYLMVAWPTLGGGAEWANAVVRLATLLGTALGIGILADVETAERLQVDRLTNDAHARERFIDGIVESLREGLVALDAEGRVVTWNEAMARRKSIPTADALGQDFIALFRGHDTDLWAGALRRLLSGEVDEFSLETVELQTPRGQVIVNLRGSRLPEGGAVLLIEDITQRVALERSARQSEKLAALGTLAAGVAHELNNPIGVISSRVELMLLDADAQGLPVEAREDLSVLHRHAQRVARIARGLLSFARQSPRDRGPVDINRLVEDTLILVEKSITRDGVVLSRELAPALPTVWGDASALQQVLVNLLTNAGEAVAGAGRIEVRTAAGRHGDVHVTVHDTGRGIPPDALPRIFDPFFTTKSEGTGLGLAISYGIVRDHGGTIDVRSRPGEGATFTLTFPAQVTAKATA